MLRKSITEKNNNKHTHTHKGNKINKSKIKINPKKVR